MAKKAVINKEAIERGMKLYTKFHWGKLPKKLSKVKLHFPDAFVHLGKLLGVVYLSDKSGSPEVYVHFFGKNEPLKLTCHKGQVTLEKVGELKLSQFPDLLTDDKGKHLYIVNFKGRVKEEGITG